MGQDRGGAQAHAVGRRRGNDGDAGFRLDQPRQRCRRILPRWAKVDRLGDKVHKGAPLLASTDPSSSIGGMISLWRDPAQVVVQGDEPATCAGADSSRLDALRPVERMMALDLIGYLPDDILVKVDRAAMAVSLETRVPLSRSPRGRVCVALAAQPQDPRRRGQVCRCASFSIAMCRAS